MRATCLLSAVPPPSSPPTSLTQHPHCGGIEALYGRTGRRVHASDALSEFYRCRLIWLVSLLRFLVWLALCAYAPRHQGSACSQVHGCYAGEWINQYAGGAV